jgi:type II secretion system protein N
MLKKVGMVLLGGIWSLMVFSLTSPIFFPSAAVEKWVEYQVQESTRGTTLIDLSELSFRGLAGFSGKLDLYKGTKQRRRRRKQKAAQQVPPVHRISLDHFSLSPRVTSMLFGKAMVDFEAIIKGEEIEGAYGIDSEHQFLIMDTEDFDLASMPAFDSDDAHFDIAGKLNFSSDLSLSKTDPKESTGELKLSIDQLQLYNGKAKSMGFDLMPMNFTDAILRFNIEDGRASVTDGRFLGDLIDAEVEGDIILNKKLSRSRLSLRIKAKILDTAMDGLLKTMSATKRARDDEGYYHFRGSGTVTNPRFAADRTQSRGGASAGDDDIGGSPSSGRRARKGLTNDDDDDDASERRSKRRERIKKRRERMKERRKKRRERESDDTEEDGPDDDGAQDDAFPDNGRGNNRRSQESNQLEPEFIEPRNQQDYQPEFDDFEEDNGPPPNEDDEQLEELGYLDE